MVAKTSGQSATSNSKESSAQREVVSGGTGFVSLLIVLHLVCVGIALTSNLYRSSLQGRLIGVLRPYLGLLNLDPDFTPYHLTHGQPLDEDHFLEVEVLSPSGQTRRETLERVDRWGFAGRRYRRLAYLMAYHAKAENDHINAALARAVAVAVLGEQEDLRAIVRCKRHESQPRRLTELAAGFPEDPDDLRYEQTVYEAEVWWAGGKLQVQKRVSGQESAQLDRKPAENSPAGDFREREKSALDQRE